MAIAPKKRNRLRNLKINEISLVLAPAVPAASTMVLKSGMPSKAVLFSEALTGHSPAPAKSTATVVAPIRAAHPLTRAVMKAAAEANATPRGGRSIIYLMADTLADSQDTTLPVAARVAALGRLAVQVPLAAQAVQELTDQAKAHAFGKVIEQARAILSTAKAIEVGKAGEHPLIAACRRG
jgi:hypothetical protein